ncbi:MAG: hypothetical protein LWX54_16370, partial [Deltaproteobacteria bacterium]|nr:hypothetical protein [Deltaproteobacteria bacterium]
MIHPEYLDQDFWNVGKQEHMKLRELKTRVEANDRAIQMGKRALALQGTPGFNDFVEAVEGARKFVADQLLTSTNSNDYLRVLQGKAQALNDVMALLRQTE